MKKILLPLLLSSFFFTFNSYAFLGNEELKQDMICDVANGDEAKEKCKDGNILMWKPKTFGNEQLPILYISLFCDFNRPITHTVGGVSCVFTTKRKSQWVDYGVQP